jgi:hypothetical protein
MPLRRQRGPDPARTDQPDPWRVPGPAPRRSRTKVVTEAPVQLTRQVTELLRRLSGPEGSTDEVGEVDERGEPGHGQPRDRRGRGRLMAQLTAALAASARAAGVGAVASGRWLGDLVEELAPYVSIRDLNALQQAYQCEGDALAEAVIRSASHATAALGAAAGALAAAELAAPPTLLATPVQLAAETLAVIAVELRLLGELHEVYGTPLRGSASARASQLLTTWVRRRALEPGAGSLLLGATARRELRKRVLRRMGGSVSTLAPFLAGAVAGAEINRRETRKLGGSVSKDLRVRALPSFPAERLIEGHLSEPRPTGDSPG